MSEEKSYQIPSLPVELTQAQEARRSALTEIHEAGKLKDGDQLIKEFLELEPKFQDLKLKGQALERYFSLSDELKRRFGSVAIDGGYQAVVDAWKAAQSVESMPPGHKTGTPLL